MNEPKFDAEQAHKWFAIEFNNRAWDLLEKPDRTDAEDAELIHTAHASCRHWLQVGGGANAARAECLVANAHAALKDGHAALRHAGLCEKLTEENQAELADWDIAFAKDCAARAHAASGETERATELKRQARAAGDRIQDGDDKSFFDAWHAAGEWHGVASS